MMLRLTLFKKQSFQKQYGGGNSNDPIILSKEKKEFFPLQNLAHTSKGQIMDQTSILVTNTLFDLGNKQWSGKVYK